jgi:hypothetical protein
VKKLRLAVGQAQMSTGESRMRVGVNRQAIAGDALGQLVSAALPGLFDGPPRSLLTGGPRERPAQAGVFSSGDRTARLSPRMLRRLGVWAGVDRCVHPLRRRGSLNWTFTHERFRMIHQRRRCGTLIRAIFSISSLVLDHALSPAFDVAKGVPPRKVRAARTKVIKMIVAPLGNGPIDVRDRALILIGFAGALPHSELVPRDVGKADAAGRVLRIRR